MQEKTVKKQGCGIRLMLPEAYRYFPRRAPNSGNTRPGTQPTAG